MANKQVIGFEINGINIPLGDVSEPIVDSSFNENSVHPVQNKTITEEFDKKANIIIKEVFYGQCFRPSLIDLKEGIEISIQDTSDFDQVRIENIRCGQYDPKESALLTTDYTMDCVINLGKDYANFSTIIVFDDTIKNLCKNSSNIGVEIHYIGPSDLSIKGHQGMDLIDVYSEQPLKVGNYSNSYVLEKGKALSPMSFASGQNADDENSSVVAIAGCKGFYYYSYSNYGNSQNKIELSTSQPIGQKNSPRTWDDASQALLSKWKDKKINIVGSHKHTMCATVSEVQENGVIITSKLPFGEKIPFTSSQYSGISWGQSSYDWDDGAIYCPELPEEGTVILGKGARSIGSGSIAAGTYSVAEGKETLAANDFAHAEGEQTKAGYASHAEGYYTTALDHGAHAEGDCTTASKYASHAEGSYTQALGNASHAEGHFTKTINNSAHAEGESTCAAGLNSHAEGQNTTASANNSHAEGEWSRADGYASHAEGQNTTATAPSSHAEGDTTLAGEHSSHAEGSHTKALGYYSHAEGRNTIVHGECGHVQGKYNIEDTEGLYAHIVGNGTTDDARSNAHTLDWNGNAWYAGGVRAQNVIAIESVEADNVEVGSNVISNRIISQDLTVNNNAYIDTLQYRNITCGLIQFEITYEGQENPVYIKVLGAEV